MNPLKCIVSNDYRMKSYTAVKLRFLFCFVKQRKMIYANDFGRLQCVSVETFLMTVIAIRLEIKVKGIIRMEKICVSMFGGGGGNAYKFLSLYFIFGFF